MTFPFIPPIGAKKAGYTIAKSLRFRSSASAYLSRTPGSAGNRQKWTWSGWVKRGAIGNAGYIFAASWGTTNSTFLGLFFNATDNLSLTGYTSSYITTTQVFRDVSAWYHIVLTVDVTSATTTITGGSTDRIRLYVNGVQVSSFSTTAVPTQNTNLPINAAQAHYFAGWNTGSGISQIFDGYLSEVNFIDGQALDPTYFGQTDTATGVWMPKAYTGSYGTNGFYLNFSDASAATAAAIGKDSSGNGNNWTPNNISVTAGVTYDSMVDTPTNYDNGGNGAGNYCVLNPLSFNSSNVVDGNLAYLGANNTSTRATFATPTSGKWYWELTPVNASPNYVGFGLMGASTTGANNFGTAAAGVWGIYPTGTMYISNNGSIANSGISTPALGVVFAAAYDADTGNFWIGYASSGSGSPTWFNSTGGTTGNPATGANPMATIAAQTLFPAVSGNNTTSDKSAINFGQRPFALTVPTGFKALCTQNLPTPTIGATSSTLANRYFDISLYTGTAASQSVTNNGAFQPDFLWIKSRSAGASNPDHQTFNAVSGHGAVLYTDLTNAEYNSGTAWYSVASNGFSLTSSTQLNTSAIPYVAWQWKANGSGSTIAVNAYGSTPSIASTVSANVTAGFSVVTYTGNATAGATVGHGLGVAPSMIIVKCRGVATSWPVYHKSSGATNWILLNSTAANTTSAQEWNNTAPTSAVFSIGNASSNSNQASTYVAYCFAEVAGYSKFGSYTANASTDGPMVYCGFRPRYVMFKNTTRAGNWLIYDTARNTYNAMDLQLYPDLSSAELSGANVDYLSNGFKIRAGSGSGLNNTSGDTYIYAAFAESPFNYARAR